MALEEQLKKYLEDKKDLRLTIILESFNKKATKKNLDAVKLLLEDNDIESLKAFLGAKEAKEKEKPIQLEEFPHSQDDFIQQVIRTLGKPDDQNSLGNRILRGETYTGHLKTNIKPSVLINKFATLAGKDQIQIDEHPRFNPGSNVMIWEFAIPGTKEVTRIFQNKVNG